MERRDRPSINDCDFCVRASYVRFARMKHRHEGRVDAQIIDSDLKSQGRFLELLFQVTVLIVLIPSSSNRRKSSWETVLPTMKFMSSTHFDIFQSIGPIVNDTLLFLCLRSNCVCSSLQELTRSRSLVFQ
jgi:hypothetical protein